MIHTASTMAFSDLARALDVEWFLERDGTRAPKDLTIEDAALIGDAPSSRVAFERWLEGRRRGVKGESLGLRVATMLRGLHLSLVVASLLAGGSAAYALLFQNAASSPTNVLTFLISTLAWPLGFLLLSLTLFAMRRRLGEKALLVELYTFGVELIGRAFPERKKHTEGWAVQWRALRRRHERYRDIELLTASCAAQWYAAAFHLGALFTLTRAALFTDLTFAWSTTARALERDTLATFFDVLTAPWCETLRFGCVSTELIQMTEFSNFQGAFVNPGGAGVSGAWWHVLALSLVVYGIGPRLLLWATLRALLARRGATIPNGALELRRRLHGGVVVTPHHTSSEPDRAPAAQPSKKRAFTTTAQSCLVVTWRDVDLSTQRATGLASQFGFQLASEYAAGGADYGQDEVVINTLTERPTDAVLFVAEGFEAPDKATRRFLRGVRESGARSRPIFVLLVTSQVHAASELEVWRNRLGLLEDPWLSVERLAHAADGGHSPLEVEV